MWAIEIKRTSTPKIEKGFYYACEDIQPNKTFIVYNGKETFPLPNGVMAISIYELMKTITAEINEVQ